MGISLGTNGISVYEHGDGYISGRAVYNGRVGSDWNHVAVTYANKVPRIYLNGALVRTGSASPRANVYAPRIIGGGAYGHFKGNVRCVGIWDGALTARQLNSDIAGEFEGRACLGVWTFTHGAHTPVNGGAHNGGQALIEGATWTRSEKGASLRFDGIDDRVQLNYSVPANNFTIALWVRAEDKHEIESRMARTMAIRHPGFPLMIFCWHRFLARFGLGQGNLDWALAGQTLTLLCRILSLVPLYYIGRWLVGGRNAFWALIALVFLPWPAEYGHDVLREWPHLLFLLAGLVLVLLAFSCGRPIYLLPAGLVAAVGHTIRPECAQIAVYAFLGLILGFLRPAITRFSRRQAVCAAVHLTCGFAVIFVPYVCARGRILPAKLKYLLTFDIDKGPSANVASAATDSEFTANKAAFFSDSIGAASKLTQRLSENQYYYFFPFMVAGLYLYFMQPGHEPSAKWFMAGFIVLNVLMLAALHVHWGYLSRRHVLPLTVITMFFVPQGLKTLARLLCRSCRASGGEFDAKRQASFFLVLIGLGILICLPKTATLKWSNTGLRKTAEYLRLNAPLDAVIAVPDVRIAFYAERNYVLYDDHVPAEHWDWVILEAPADGPKTALPHWPQALLTKTFSYSHTPDKEISAYRRK